MINTTKKRIRPIAQIQGGIPISGSLKCTGTLAFSSLLDMIIVYGQQSYIAWFLCELCYFRILFENVVSHMFINTGVTITWHLSLLMYLMYTARLRSLYSFLLKDFVVIVVVLIERRKYPSHPEPLRCMFQVGEGASRWPMLPAYSRWVCSCSLSRPVRHSADLSSCLWQDR